MLRVFLHFRVGSALSSKFLLIQILHWEELFLIYGVDGELFRKRI